MNRKSAIAILKSQNKRVTSKRLAILELFMDNSKPFALSEIEKQLSGAMDRATMYRTLHTFEAMDLVVKLIDHQGTCLYMLNHEKHKKQSIHPHLHCRECDKIVCLPCLPDEYMEGLKKYDIEEMYFLMQGKCLECSDCQKIENTNNKQLYSPT